MSVATSVDAPTAGRFPTLILALRWATVSTGALLSLVELRRATGPMAATSFLCLYAAFRMLRPLPRPDGMATPPAAIAVDLGVALLGVALSGGWGSPFVFVVLVGILLAGFTRGYVGGFAAAGASAVALLLAGATIRSAAGTTEMAAQVVLVYAATGALAGYARRLFVDAAAEQASFEDRVSRLTEANALLSELTQVALTLPSSLDLGESVATAMGHLQQLFAFTGGAVLVLDAATGTWRTEAAAGLPPSPPMATNQLPPPLLRLALRNGSGTPDGGAVAEPDLGSQPGRRGLWPDTRSGVYAPLVARDRLVALVALEHVQPDAFGSRETKVLTGLAEPLALAIDNALWFDRLRMLGAEGERDRLARDLHDRFAQGLAYVNLELDRLARHPAPGPGLVELRGEVQGLLSDVRETLRQLRSRVSETTALSDLLRADLPRFTQRTGIKASLAAEQEPARLPVTIEQELWRITQETLANVERHSKATAVDVTWSCDGRHGRLVVADDGCGFDPAEIR
ncbi:MAG: hypothetical protein QOF96_3586, partial [Actinomycetota bacterium]|nr:hypothetical protein [Actinomycetota bacterium]